MDKPMIVISAGKHIHTHPTRRSVTTLVGCDIDYLVSISLAGGAPVIIPMIADHESIRIILQAAHGVLLTGGGDIHAGAYGEALHPESRLHDQDRDNMEMEVARQALALGMPLLGICRGLQLLNVVMGGTLLQDIPSQVPGALAHNAPEHETLLHPITIESDTSLARIMHATSVMVNSWHHQALKTLGHGLRISARAEDGVVEGIESAEGKPILAVQCHPEACTDGFPCYLTLFHWLVEEAQGYRRMKNGE